MIQNKKMEDKLKNEEKKLYDQWLDHKNREKRSKSFWKSGLHVMENFGPLIIDKVHKIKDLNEVKKIEDEKIDELGGNGLNNNNNENNNINNEQMNHMNEI